MCFLLEMLGRGLLTHLAGAFANVLPADDATGIDGLAQTVRDNPRDCHSRLRLGVAQLRGNRLVAARQTFEVLASCDPRSLPALIGLACAHDELGNTDAALDRLRAAQRIDPANPAIHERTIVLGAGRGSGLIPRDRIAR